MSMPARPIGSVPREAAFTKICDRIEGAALAAVQLGV